MLFRDFPGGPVVETLPANAGIVGSVPDRELRSLMPLNQKTETYNGGNIVTNSIQTFKNGPHKKKSLK